MRGATICSSFARSTAFRSTDSMEMKQFGAGGGVVLIPRAKEALHRGNHCDLKDSLVSHEGAQKDDTGLSQVCGNIKRYFYISGPCLRRP